MDPDDKIRSRVILALGSVAIQMPDLISLDTFQKISVRCRDKKNSVRKEAIRILAKLFHTTYTAS